MIASPRHAPSLAIALLFLSLALRLAAAEEALPKVTDGRLVLTRFAAEPNLVTPIGVAVDARGRVYVLESHTHFPKPDYAGPKADRVKVFEDTDGDGRGDRVTVFHEGLHHGMNLALGPEGRLHATHRNGLVRLEDTDGDGHCDRRVDLLVMETPGTYPHNGIGALAFSPDGWVYVGQGENLGEKFTLRGTDGRSFSDREGGYVFRCRPDGSGLEVVASGFWNPFGLAFFGGEYLLAVDNDPDSRPPNRLLDLIPQGDYGYKFRFGRSGLHPFQAWNGELPGTLPMVSGVGEGSSAVMACDRTAFPRDYHEAVLVTAGWDHRIEVYRPRSFGASLRAEREILVEGDAQFRPIGLATAPDGAVFFTDWVDVSYNVHGKGRLWRLAPKSAGAKPGAPLVLKPGRERKHLRELLAAVPDRDQARVFAALGQSDPFVVSAAVTALSRPEWRLAARRALMHPVASVRLGGLLALRRAAVTNAAQVAGAMLPDPNPAVRLMAVIWTGESALVSLTNQLEAALRSGPVTPALVRAHGAAAQILAQAAGGAGLGSAAAAFDFRETPDATRALEVLRAPASKTPAAARLDAVRALFGTTNADAVGVLRRLAANRREPSELRADAVAALTAQPAATAVLLELVVDGDAAVRLAAARALRPVSGEREVQQAFARWLKSAGPGRDPAVREELAYALELAGIAYSGAAGTNRPASVAEWRQALVVEGDAAQGRRVFFSSQAGCARCHRIEDLGGRLGPDLSTIARGANREKLIYSILEPSRDIPPQFVAHTVEARDGQSWTGLLLAQTADGTLTLATMEGRAMVLPGQDIASHTQSKVSLMPTGLERALTVGEFRDLLAFLLSRK